MKSSADGNLWVKRDKRNSPLVLVRRNKTAQNHNAGLHINNQYQMQNQRDGRRRITSITLFQQWLWNLLRVLCLYILGNRMFPRFEVVDVPVYQKRNQFYKCCWKYLSASTYCYKSMPKCKVVHFCYWWEELPEETHLHRSCVHKIYVDTIIEEE